MEQALLLIALGLAGFVLLANFDTSPKQANKSVSISKTTPAKPLTGAAAAAAAGAGGMSGAGFGGAGAGGPGAGGMSGAGFGGAGGVVPYAPTEWTPTAAVAAPGPQSRVCGPACSKLRQLRVALDDAIASSCS